MRYDTHKVRTEFVNRLFAAGKVADVWDDGTDTILATLRNGRVILIHLIENQVSLPEIRDLLKHNTATGFYTLFVFRADFLLPRRGDHYPMDDWMAALAELSGSTLYGYDVFGSGVWLFPVHFDGVGNVRHIRYGEELDLRRLDGMVAQSTAPMLEGMWRVAGFHAVAAETRRERGERTWSGAKEGGRPAPAHPIGVYYAALDIAVGADLETVKAAYRALAKQYHPDLNTSEDATVNMQRINEAYYYIMQQFDE